MSWLKKALGNGWSSVLGLSKDRQAAEQAERNAKLQQQQIEAEAQRARDLFTTQQEAARLKNQAPINDVANIQSGAAADAAVEDSVGTLAKKRKGAQQNITVGL